MGAIANFTPAQLATIRHTVASDTNDSEFNLFMEAARSYGLDPFRRQINALVFSKNNPEKRKMTIIVSRDGLRVIAQRCGDYRPASDRAELITDDEMKGPNNPLGIVSCSVKLHKRDKDGTWYPVYGEAYWDEFAPLKEKWDLNPESGRREPTGKFELEPGNWTKMPRLMLQKCAEAQALRAGWPDSFSGLYAEEELDQARAREMQDITPADMVKQDAAHKRQNALGHKGVLMTFDSTGVLERVPYGNVADRCLAFIEQADGETVYRWSMQNREALKDFWAECPGDAFELKKAIESKTALLTAGAKAPKNEAAA